MAKNSSGEKQSSDTNKQPFFDADGAVQSYHEAVTWFRPYFASIPEYERILRNKPSDRISPELPRITDGTTAAQGQETPKRIIQQLITGLVECEDYEEFAKIADIVNRYIILPHQNRMGTSLQKQWNMMSKAWGWGRSTSYTFFTNTNGVFHTDYIIPYYADVLSETGKVYAPDSNISHLRSWYQKRDLQAIINREKWLIANHKGYETDWDLEAIADLMMAGGSAKPAEQMTPSEQEKGQGSVGGFEVIHAFQKGIKAEFYSFAPRKNDSKDRNLRKRLNKDPRGNMPLDYEYCNLDLSNPLGRGQVELNAGIQNIMDQKLQMNQFLTAMLMGPPLQVWGNINKATLKFRPNAMWDMGNNQNNRVEPYTINNVAISSFVGDMQFLQSKLYNLSSSQDNSIPADSGSVGQSKTQAGVKASEQRLGVSDNYLRKQHEEWAEAQTETSLNIFFAEMTGKTDIKLKKEDIKDLAKTPSAEYLTQDGKLKIPYDKISDVTFKFKVDASSSEIKEDAGNAEKLTEVYTLMSQDPDPQIQQKKVKVLKALIDEIGAEGTDDLFPDEELDENGQPIQQQAQDPNAILQQIMPMMQQMVEEGIKAAEKPQEDPTLALIKALGVKFNDIPEDSRKIILDHLGMPSEEDTPAEERINMDLLTALNATDSGIAGEEQAREQNAIAQQSAQSQNQAGMQSDVQQPIDEALSPEETEMAEALIERGFQDEDIDQAIQMMRAGQTLEEIIPTIGAKYATN